MFHSPLVIIPQFVQLHPQLNSRVVAFSSSMAGRTRARAHNAKSSENEAKLASSTKAEAELKNDNLIKINRAPVLTLWVAVVAEREGYSFQEALSFGKYIAGIFAHSKGRRLGIIDETDEPRKRKKTEAAEKFNVFGMKIGGETSKDGTRLALQNGKAISPSSVESYLRRAFGSHYEQVLEAMRDVAKAYPPERIG